MERLLELANTIENMKGDSMPNFNKVKLYFIRLFTYNSEPGLFLINHYYETSCIYMDTFSYDISIRVKHCRTLDYFAKLCKSLWKMRNVMVHGDYLTRRIFINLLYNIFEFYNRCNRHNNIKWALNKLVHELIKCCEIILNIDCEYENICFHCGHHYEIEEEIPLQLSDEISIIEVKDTMREEIKGKKILICSGKWEGCEAIFGSWSGTNCSVKIFNKDSDSLHKVKMWNKISIKYYY